MSGYDDPLLKELRDDFRVAADANEQQRRREQKDLAYVNPDFQWDEDAKAARQGGEGIPGRPMLSVPKLNQPVNQIGNQMRTADLGIQVQPVNATAKKESAEVRQDLYRKIERDSNAPFVRFWAFDRAIKCGSGAYVVRTEYDDDSESPFDQRLAIRRIYDQGLVYFDPAAEMADNSDGRFAIVGAWVPRDTFRRRFPKAQEDYTSAELFQFLQQNEPRWATTEGSNGAVFVAEWYRRTFEEKNLLLMADGSTAYEGEHGGRAVHKSRLSRPMRVPKVEIIQATACEVLTEGLWMGKYIPVIPVIGQEEQPYDGERRRAGLITYAKGPAKAYNYAVTTALEVVALEPKAPHRALIGAIEGLEQQWILSNTQNIPVLYYKPVRLEDGSIHTEPPSRDQIDMGKLGMAMQLAQQMDQDVQASTAVFDPSLGNISSKEKSGKAILALQQQSEAGTSQYLQNFAQVTLPYEARVILDAMPHVYDRPGRIEHVLNAENESRRVALNVPYVDDPDTGMPREVEEGTKDAKFYDFAHDGSYSYAISVGKSHQTRLQAGQDALSRLVEADPATLGTVLGPLLMQYSDFPGHQEAAELWKELRAMKFPGIGEQPDTTDPKELQMQLRAAQAQIQQLQGQLKQAAAMQMIDAEKQRATIEKTEMDNATKLALGELQAKVDLAKAQNDLAIAEMKLRMDSLNQMAGRADARAAAGADRQHQRGMALDQAATTEAEASANRAHETSERLGGEAFQERTLAEQQAQEAAMTAMGAQVDADAAADQRGHEVGMAGLEASLAPQPDGGDV